MKKERKAFISRLADSVETALKFGEGYIIVEDQSSDPPQDLFFSESLTCPEHGVSLPEIEPRNFSFNTPHGACPECQGLGIRQEIDPDLFIPDKELSFNEGAIQAMEWNDAKEQGQVLLADVEISSQSLSYQPGYTGRGYSRRKAEHHSLRHRRQGS